MFNGVANHGISINHIRGSLRAIIAAILYALLTFGLFAIILLVAMFRCSRLTRWLGLRWNDGNNFILALTTHIQWNIEGISAVDPTQSYFVIANHQSWADIIVLQKALPPGMPLSRYFIKKQLAHIPIVGWCLRALDFPIMERFSKEKLKKYPELRGKDIETTRRACEKFKNIPVALISFVEGTRFTPTKHQRTASPYQHLLIPKAGGLAFAIQAMAPYAKQLLDVTIAYDHPSPPAWYLFSGKIKRVSVYIEEIPITPDLIGDYQNDMEFRRHFQKWLNDRWAKKDTLLAPSP
ncbi:MAG: acyltransferase [Gammaproteobacteria bacterium]